MEKGKDVLMEKNAQYLADVLKNPAGIAVVMFRVFTAMMKAGFTEPQAMDITKNAMAMIIGMGAYLDEH